MKTIALQDSKGFATVLVLGIIAVFTLLLIAFSVNTRTERQISRNSMFQVHARMAAQHGISRCSDLFVGQSISENCNCQPDVRTLVMLLAPAAMVSIAAKKIKTLLFQG